MFTLRVVALRRLPVSSSKLLCPSLMLALNPNLRPFGTTPPLAKKRTEKPNKYPTDALGGGDKQPSTQVPPVSEVQLVHDHIRDRHTALLKLCIGMVVLDNAPYNKVISSPEIREALAETGRLLMATGIDPMNYSPRRLMNNPMVHEQVYKMDNMLDAAGMNAVYTLRAVPIFRDNPRAIRVQKSTGSGYYFRNGATGEREEIDKAKLHNVLMGTKLGKVSQSNPRFKRYMADAGLGLLARGVDPINPDDTVARPEFQEEEFGLLFMTAGLTPLDVLETTFAIQSAMSTVEWAIPDDSESESSTLEDDSPWFFKQSPEEGLFELSPMASFFELYNKALIVTSLEITSPSVKSYNIILNNQSLKEQLIATGKFLIASGIHREGRIPTKIETQRNPPVLAKLVELHNVFQGLHMCPIDLLVSVRRLQAIFDEPHIGKDNWQEIDDDRKASFRAIPGQPPSLTRMFNNWWLARQARE